MSQIKQTDGAQIVSLTLCGSLRLKVCYMEHEMEEVGLYTSYGIL